MYGSQYDSVNANNEAYWNEYNAGYQAEQDAIANALNERQMAISEANLKINQEAQRIAELQAGVERDDKGNIVGISSNNSARYADENIPQYILDKLASFDNDFDIDDYLYDLETNGTITNQQAKELATSHYLNNTVDYNLNGITNTYYVLDDGGRKIGKVDNDAKVRIRDSEGEYTEKTMEDIFDELVADGMSKKDARNKIKDLQNKLGI